MNNSEIKLNKILENDKSGIRITGEGCRPLIQGNLKISSNGTCGIIICNKASAKIFDNWIFHNSEQGILIQEFCHAKIIKNSIYKNIKANLALGGARSSESIVMHNKLY